MSTLNVHLLPQLVPADALEESTVIVVDVLRATTTIVTALAAGARAVVPCLTVDDARRRAAEFERGSVLLAGERGGLCIEGFDLGNSPAEFTPIRVRGKTIVMTTTNGTKALLQARTAREIVIGAFVNLSVVCSAVSEAAQIDIVCAGTEGEVTEEDVLAAGAMARRITLQDICQVNDAGWIAIDAWSRFAERTALLADALRTSSGGRNLLSIGMDEDIEYAAEIDRFRLVPRFNPASGEIVLTPRP